MRKSFFLLLMVLFGVGIRAESFYTAEATYEAGQEKGTCLLKVYIKQVTIEGDRETEEVIAAPGVTSKIGQPAKIEMIGGREPKDVVVSSFYPEKGGGEAIVWSVEVREKGRMVYRTRTTMKLSGIGE